MRTSILMVFLKEFLDKVNFEKKLADNKIMKNFKSISTRILNVQRICVFEYYDFFIFANDNFDR